MFKLILAILTLLSAVINCSAQKFDPADISGMIAAYKKDERGPYQAIRWFCPDGTVLLPKERCAQPGGIQHALAKDEIIKLAETRHIFLGQILAGTDFNLFLDKENQHSRFIQYQVDKFLQSSDDGWIMRRGRYYRGAIQAEDEEAWGRAFILWLLSDAGKIRRDFFIVREIIRHIPHREQDDRWQRIRSVSKQISDSLTTFMNIRVKIHGQPEKGDIKRVQNFLKNNNATLQKNEIDLIQNLLADLQWAYKEDDSGIWQRYLSVLPPESEIYQRLSNLMRVFEENKENQQQPNRLIAGLSDLIWAIRVYLSDLDKPEDRLNAIDLSVDLERSLFRQIQLWQPETLRALFDKNFQIARAAAGCGYLEIWEWNQVEPLIDPENQDKSFTIKSLQDYVDISKRVLEWGTATVKTNYSPVVNIYSQFEPLAAGFIDDHIRSSVLLAEGETVGKLTELQSRLTGYQQKVAGVNNPGQIRGINPGFALGELSVVTGDPDKIDYVAQKIYLFEQTPMDLKPVAGIATVSEGNLVSHIQLLARNLGIPNAVMSGETIQTLSQFEGQRMFYAVSPAGAVILKPESEMTEEERDLVKEAKRQDERLYIPTDRINLGFTELEPLSRLRAKGSGILCGPKAANLGELKFHFPDNVVDGFIIPFGVFREHLEQEIPGGQVSYWEFLQNLFEQAEKDRKNGITELQIESKILKGLTRLREAIKKIPFLPEFQEKLNQAFIKNFGKTIGQIPVFIRSDTNMEDLKDFTGAGLNLTVFNVRENEKILQGIRDVWASPYAERSYGWRQKYLLNPENVFPSILIIPSVNVDKSGVMVTTGIFDGGADNLTVAFNRGVGGAVEGQMAESYSIRPEGTFWLLSPSREQLYTTLPEKGGTIRIKTDFSQPVLSETDITALRKMALKIRKSNLLERPGEPVDIELGFKDDHIWLFQIRPFVESKRARSSLYLKSLDPDFLSDKKLNLDIRI